MIFLPQTAYKMWPLILVIFIARCKSQRNLQSVEAPSNIRTIDLSVDPGYEVLNKRIEFNLQGLTDDNLSLSIADTTDRFYHGGIRNARSSVQYSPDLSDSLFNGLKIGGGKISDQLWYISWSVAGENDRQRRLLIPKDSFDSSRYTLETTNHYGYILDVIGTGAESTKKLFINGKLVPVSYDKASNGWFYKGAYVPYPSLFDIGHLIITCCPEDFFND